MEKIEDYFKFHCADNNLLRHICKNGNAQLFDKYYNFLLDQKVVGAESKWAMTSGGFVEFLGMKIPPVEIDGSKYIKEVAEICKGEPVDHDRIDKIRNTMALDYEQALMQSGFFSRKKINQLMASQVGYTDPRAKWVVEGIFAQHSTFEARKSVCNRAAWDRSYAFNWPQELRGDVFATYMRDFHYMYEHKVSFASSRSLKTIWATFKPIMMTDFVTGKRRGPISFQIFERNMDLVSKALSFEKQGDFLDVEAVHCLCAGVYSFEKFDNVVFTTFDPIDNFLIRLAMYRSFIDYAAKMPCDDPNWALEVLPGLGLVFDTNLDLRYEVWVEDIAPLLDMLYMTDVEKWLESYRERFMYSGNGVGFGFFDD